MKNKIKEIIRKHKKEAMACLYPEDDYTWGTKKKNIEKTILLMNKILSKIPKSAWLIERYSFTDGNWTLDLKLTNNKRAADLRFKHDDHTAWVIESKNGKFVDFDIGGS